MAEFYAANNTIAYQTSPSGKIAPGEQGGRLRVAYDSFDLEAVTTSDTVDFMKIPAGARVLDVICYIPDTGGTSSTLVGWSASADGGEAADPNGFITATDTSGQDQKLEVVIAAAGVGKKFTEEVTLQLAPTVANWTSTSGTIHVFLEYIKE